MTTNLRAAARITVDGWTVDVEHAGQVGDLAHGIRNLWTWKITGPEVPGTNGTHSVAFAGADLTSAIDLRDPDPIAALCSLGSFLGAYAEAIEWQDRTGRKSENARLFPALLPADVAGEIADAIAAEWPDEPGPWDDCDCPDHEHRRRDCPMLRTCEDCQAEPGEPCRPDCLSHVDTEEG